MSSLGNVQRGIEWWVVLALLVGGGALLCPSWGVAQSYPQRTVRVYVAADASEVLQQTADLLAQAATDGFDGGPVVVKRVGASDTLALARSLNGLRALGYDLALLPYPDVARMEWIRAPAATSANQIQRWSDIRVVGILAHEAMVLVGSGDATDAGRVLMEIQNRDGGSVLGWPERSTPILGGAASLALLLRSSIELLEQETVSHTMDALGQGSVHAAFAMTSDIAILDQREDIQVLGLASAAQHPRMPYVRTLIDQEIPLQAYRQYVLVAPVDIPEPVVRLWHRQLRQIFKDSQVRLALYDLGLFPGPATEPFDAQRQPDRDQSLLARSTNQLLVFVERARKEGWLRP